MNQLSHIAEISARWVGRFRELPNRLAAGVLLSALLSPLALAEPDDWLDQRSSGATPGTSSFVAQPSVSAAQAAAYVRRAHGGRVLSVSPSRRGDTLGYRVRVLVDGGRVKTVYVDSGRVSRTPGSARAPIRAIGDQ